MTPDARDRAMAERIERSMYSVRSSQIGASLVGAIAAALATARAEERAVCIQIVGGAVHKPADCTGDGCKYMSNAKEMCPACRAVHAAHQRIIAALRARGEGWGMVTDDDRRDFLRYEKVRASGKFNMRMDARGAAKAAGLSKDRYIDIMQRYVVLRAAIDAQATK